MKARWRYIPIVILALAVLVLPSAAPAAGGGAGPGPGSIQDEARFCYEIWSSFMDDSHFDGVDPEEGGGSRTVPATGLPVAYDSAVTTAANTPVEITLNATYPGGDVITYGIESGPLNGTAGAVIGDRVVYTPDEGFHGGDSFTFRATNGKQECLATVTITVEPPCPPPHAFSGTVTIDGKPAPGNTMVSVAGEGVLPDISGNPVATQPGGSYGSASGTGHPLVAEGRVEDGTFLAFFVEGTPAEVRDVAANGSWQPGYPFTAGAVTDLDLRVVTPVPPPPDSVHINAISLTISSTAYGFFQSLNLEKNPWVEVTVTPGIYTIRISATGYHDFRDVPVMGRYATLAIYDGDRPVSPVLVVPFGAKTVTYEYLANETKTFDVRISVDESPEISDVKHITIFAASP